MNIKLLKSFSLSLLQRASLPLFGFGTFYILVRSLNSDELGQWALFIALTASLEGAKDGLMKNAIVHYLNATGTEVHAAVKSAALLLNFVVTGIFALSVYFLAEWLSTILDAVHLKEMLQFYAINLIMLVFFSHFNFIQQAKVSYLGILLSFVGRQGLLFFTVLYFIVINNQSLELIQLVYIQLVGIILGTLISYFFTRKFLTHQVSLTREWFIKVWKFGRYGMFTNISVSIITSTDHLMLGGMISTGSVAVYNVAVKITNFFNLPAVALSGVLLPSGVKSAASNDTSKLKSIFEMAIASTLTGLIPSVLAVLIIPELIIEFIAGEEYMMAKDILRVIILTTLIMPFFQSYGMIVNALGKPKLDFIFITIISLFNILANYLLIGSIGIAGAAYASLLTHVVGLIFIFIVLKKLVQIEISRVGVRLLDMYKKLFFMVLSKAKTNSGKNG